MWRMILKSRYVGLSGQEEEQHIRHKECRVSLSVSGSEHTVHKPVQTGHLLAQSPRVHRTPFRIGIQAITQLQVIIPELT